MVDVASKASLVVCRSNQGAALRAPISRLTRHAVTFEICDPNFVLRTSEVLTDFSIVLGARTIYTGRAVIASVINTGTVIVCEATLDETLLNPTALESVCDASQVQSGFEAFIRDWGKNYRVLPEFKVLLADMNNYLSDLRLWLEQVELGIRSITNGDRLRLEYEILSQIQQPMKSTLNPLFEKFEFVAAKIAPEEKAAHRVCVRRQIHPLVFSSPFAHRTFHKPLGYAGDYEMVNMILRDPFEGNSLFGKVLNAWFVSQPPAEAHRNRIRYLTRQLLVETARVAREGRRSRVFNLGCGPAGEVQRFLTEHDLSNRADLTLLDFNDETLAYTTKVLQDLKCRHHRTTGLKMVKKSVVQILKRWGKSGPTLMESQYDFVYCAGLFDYLTDPHCRQLMDIFYEMLAPGGLLVATNVDAFNPIQQMLDYVLEWVLIYRTGGQLRTLAPTKADPENVSVQADETSVNLYLEVRKPAL